MALEIERKFLLTSSSWRKKADKGTSIIQGYLNSAKNRTVRIRIMDRKGILTIKGQPTGITRLELEYDIPYEEAQQLIALCEQPLIEKTRFKLIIDGQLWEIDEFHGDNKGLIVAEIELDNEKQLFTRPDWIGEEVSYNERYYNASLIKRPYLDWSL